MESIFSSDLHRLGYLPHRSRSLGLAKACAASAKPIKSGGCLTTKDLKSLFERANGQHPKLSDTQALNFMKSHEPLTAPDPVGRRLGTLPLPWGGYTIQGIAEGAMAEEDESPTDEDQSKTRAGLDLVSDRLTLEGHGRIWKEATIADAELLAALVAYWDGAPSRECEALDAGHALEFLPAFTRYCEHIFDAYSSELSNSLAQGLTTKGEFRDQLRDLCHCVLIRVCPKVWQQQKDSWVAKILWAHQCSEAAKPGVHSPEVRRLRREKFRERFWSYFQDESIRLEFWSAIESRLHLRIDTHWFPLAFGPGYRDTQGSTDYGDGPGVSFPIQKIANGAMDESKFSEFKSRQARLRLVGHQKEQLTELKAINAYVRGLVVDAATEQAFRETFGRTIRPADYLALGLLDEGHSEDLRRHCPSVANSPPPQVTETMPESARTAEAATTRIGGCRGNREREHLDREERGDRANERQLRTLSDSGGGLLTGHSLRKPEPLGAGSTGPAANDGGQERACKSAVGCNIDRLRKQCGWSFDGLAKSTGLDKKLILGHVNKGKGAHPRTLKTYADAFSKGLSRPVSVAELEV